MVQKEIVSFHRLYKQKKISASEYLDWWAKQNDYRNMKEYYDLQAQKKGYKNHSDMVRIVRNEKGIHKPISKNKQCGSYLGIYIAERVLSKIFKEVKCMPIHNRGYDFICNKGYKVDVKSATISTDGWRFTIDRNSIADYFILLAFDNRENLNPMHLWLIKGNETVKAKKLHKKVSELKTLTIVNTDYGLSIYLPYEQKNKFDDVVLCCDGLRQ